MTGSGSLKDRAARSARWTSISSATNTALQLLQVGVLARLIDKGDFGTMAMAMVLVGFATLFEDAGFSAAVVHKRQATKEQLSSLFWLNLAVGVGLFATIQLITPVAVAFYEDADPEALGSVFRWTSVVFLLSPFGQVFAAVMWRDLRFRRLAVAEIGAVSLGATAAITMALSGGGVQSLVVGTLVRTAAQAALSAALAWSLWRPTLRFRRRELEGFLGFGVLQVADRSVLYGSRQLDKLMIGRWFGDLTLGPYGLAYNLMFRPVTAINPVITRVTTALFATIQDDHARLRRGFLDLIELQSLIMVPVALGMLAVAEPLIAVYLGQGYDEVPATLQIMAPLCLLFSLRNGAASLLLAKGRVDMGLVLNLVPFLLAIPAVWFGSRWGVQGIAAGLVLVHVVVKPLELWMFHSLVGLPWLAYLGRVGPYLFAGLVMAVVVLFAESLFATMPAPVSLILLVALGAVIYVSIVLTVRRRFARDVLRMVRKAT